MDENKDCKNKKCNSNDESLLFCDGVQTEKNFDTTLLLQQLLCCKNNDDKDNISSCYSIDSTSVCFQNHQPNIDHDQAASRLGDALLIVYKNNVQKNKNTHYYTIKELYININHLSDCTYKYESLFQFIKTKNSVKRIILDGNGNYSDSCIASLVVVIERFLLAIERSNTIQDVELIGCPNIYKYHNAFTSLISTTQSIKDLAVDCNVYSTRGRDDDDNGDGDNTDNNNSNEIISDYDNMIAQAFIKNTTLKRFYMKISGMTLPFALHILNNGIRYNKHLEHLAVEWLPTTPQDHAFIRTELSEAIHNAITFSSTCIKHLELHYFGFHDSIPSFQPIGDAIKYNNSTLQNLTLESCILGNIATIQLEQAIILRNQPFNELTVTSSRLLRRRSGQINNQVMDPLTTMSKILVANQVEYLRLDMLKLADRNGTNYNQSIINNFVNAVERSTTLTALSMDYIRNEALFQGLVTCIPKNKFLRELKLQLLFNDEKKEERKGQLEKALQKNGSLIKINIFPKLDNNITSKITNRNIWLHQWRENLRNVEKKHNALSISPTAFFKMQSCTYGIEWILQDLIMMGDDVGTQYQVVENNDENEIEIIN